MICTITVRPAHATGEKFEVIVAGYINTMKAVSKIAMAMVRTYSYDGLKLEELDGSDENGQEETGIRYYGYVVDGVVTDVLTIEMFETPEEELPSSGLSDLDTSLNFTS